MAVAMKWPAYVGSGAPPLRNSRMRPPTAAYNTQTMRQRKWHHKSVINLPNQSQLPGGIRWMGVANLNEILSAMKVHQHWCCSTISSHGKSG
jgi:hypothetical protein